jgi:hypothetical protein
MGIESIKDILPQVFSYFDCRQLARIERVCRLFKEMSKEAWKDIFLRDFGEKGSDKAYYLSWARTYERILFFSATYIESPISRAHLNTNNRKFFIYQKERFSQSEAVFEDSRLMVYSYPKRNLLFSEELKDDSCRLFTHNKDLIIVQPSCTYYYSEEKKVLHKLHQAFEQIFSIDNFFLFKHGKEVKVYFKSPFSFFLKFNDIEEVTQINEKVVLRDKTNHMFIFDESYSFYHIREPFVPINYYGKNRFWVLNCSGLVAIFDTLNESLSFKKGALQAVVNGVALLRNKEVSVIDLSNRTEKTIKGISSLTFCDKVNDDYLYYNVDRFFLVISSTEQIYPLLNIDSSFHFIGCEVNLIFFAKFSNPTLEFRFFNKMNGKTQGYSIQRRDFVLISTVLYGNEIERTRNNSLRINYEKRAFIISFIIRDLVPGTIFSQSYSYRF